ncbi:MAG: toll/interleukin-1 receptor domain-containing protein [Anaerolineae bacterium]|nr:toll/interleukin-1 receptor domain-containing protein [Anaerolineae bacterium]
MHDVFLSYRSSEINIRDDLRVKLEQLGLRVWVDHNNIREGEAPKKDGIPVGSDWLPTIIAAIQTTPIFIGLFSPEAVKSTIVNLEMSLAYHLYKHQTDGARLHIPIFMDNVQIPARGARCQRAPTDMAKGQGFHHRPTSRLGVSRVASAHHT